MKQLHSAKDAIEQAIEGGWHPRLSQLLAGTEADYMEFGNIYDIVPELAFTDPLFWKTLGEARGWNKTIVAGKGERNVTLDYAKEWFLNRMIYRSETKFWESLP